MWLLINSAMSGASKYDLYVANIDRAAPFANWFIVRTTTSAVFIGRGETIDRASWSTNPNLNSTTAWERRARLTYSSHLVIPNYAGDPALQGSPNGGAGMIYTGELSAVPLTTGDWTNISTGMRAGTSYRIVMVGQALGHVAIAPRKPSAFDPSSPIGIEIGEPARDENIAAPLKFSGTPIWVWTDATQAPKVQRLIVA